MKTKEEILSELKDRYGFSKTDTRWLPEGSSILEYIGIDLIVIEFTRDVEKNDWDSHLKRGIIISMTDFEPMSGTYLCKYKTDGMESDSWKEVRIIPEGFELIGPDSNKMVRFMPYSLHSKMVETEEFYKKLFIKQAKENTLDIRELVSISDTKDQERVLEYFHNIGALIKTIDNEILWFRIKKISVKHIHGTKYTITITSWDNKRYTLNEISSDEKDYKFVVEHSEVGRLKFIDLAR